MNKRKGRDWREQVRKRDERAETLRRRRAQERGTRKPRERVDLAAVFARDKGKCAHCGVDTDHIQHWLAKLPGSWERATVAPKLLGARVAYGRRDKHTTAVANGALLGRHRGRALVLLGRLWGVVLDHGVRLWNADHIIAVAEGGAGLGLKNLQTLCLRCHRIKTTEQAGRARRRPTKGVGFGFG